MKLSPQAVGALLMTLQKCLAEQADITEMLSDWELTSEDNLLYVTNTPTVSVATEDTTTSDSSKI